MKWGSVAVFLSLALSACGASGSDSGSPNSGSPEPPSAAARPGRVASLRQFMALMEENDRQVEAIHEDLKQGRGDVAIKERLSAVRAGMETARKLRPRKSEEENDELAEEWFPQFLTALGELEQASWTAEEGPRLWKTLQVRCKVCHGRFRD